MKYRIFNTAHTDQYIPVSHGAARAGATGMDRKIGSKIKVPGTSRGENKNFFEVDEGTLRSVFGLYKRVSPGVVDPKQGTDLVIQNVTRNRPMLDNGRLVVVDGNGNHVFGHGTKEYQAKVSDAALKENQELKDKAANFIQLLVADGFTEEDAKKIYEGKLKLSDAKVLVDKVYSVDPKVKGKKGAKEGTPVIDPVPETPTVDPESDVTKEEVSK